MNFIKQLIPENLLKLIRPYYHGFFAWLGSVRFGGPSQKMIIIGVTGTNGKSTTVNLIARILQEAGYKVGYTSTVTVNIDGQEHLNKMKMTMPSGWVLQKWLSKMLKAGCQYAVLEISSEGLAQNRHVGINFDVAVFTNLTPEHLESHGGFENYKQAKGKLFSVLSKHSVKAEPLSVVSTTNKPTGTEVQKTIVTNADDQHAEYYAGFKAQQHISYGMNNPLANFLGSNPHYFAYGIDFTLKNMHFAMHLKGQFDVYNALAAIAVAQSQNISLEICKTALEKVPVIPGRVEVVQQKPFCVVVDYAYEPEEMRQLYETVSCWPHNKIIQVLGPTGGGRDQARIPVLGKMAAEFASIVFITIDDPYDDDPKTLIHKMAEGAEAAGKIVGQNLFRNPDRRGAIAKAFSLAEEGDLVLITGKGADQKMALANGKYIDWDDRKVAREELGHKELNTSKTFTERFI